jgi:hypothetical protein
MRCFFADYRISHRPGGALWPAMGPATLFALVWSWHASAGVVVSWDGSCGNSFWTSQCGSMTNWNTDEQTTLGDQVSIGPGDPVVNILFDAQAGTLTCESGLWIDAALELAGNGAIRDLTLSSIAQRALKINAGQVTLTGNTNWEQGRVGGAGVLRNESLMTGSMHMVDTATFVNATDARMRSGTIEANAVAINSLGAFFTLESPTVGAQNGLGGLGMFVNHGMFEHNHLANSIIHVDCPYLQDTGSLAVNTGSASNATTFFRHSATFSGGEFTIAGDARVHLFVPGSGGVYTFDGLPAVTGSGNLHFSTAWWSEVRVLSDLDVNLTGTDGLVINNTYTTLGGVLRNQGKVKWQGNTLRQTQDRGVPQFRNEGQVTIVTSGIGLQTWFNNTASGTVSHDTGGIGMNDDGLITNHGTYTHYRGSISRASGATFGAFSNYGTYIRPDHANTMNEQISAPFVLNPGSTATYEKAQTEYANGIGSGLFLLGGDVSIHENAMVRVAGGHCESEDSDIHGAGEFHIGGFPAPAIHFDVLDEIRLECALGPTIALAGGAADAGLYLDINGRVGGTGEIENNYNFYWNGGVIGHNGAGGIFNGRYTELISGTVDGANAWFANGYHHMVEQTGSLSIFHGTVTNDGNWWVIEPVNISSFGTGLFENFAEEGDEFRCDAGAGEVVNILARFDNQGVVRVATGRANFGNLVQVTGTTLSGGTWRVDANGILDLPGNLTTIGPGTSMSVYGTLIDFETIHTVTGLDGNLKVNGAAWNEPTVNITNGATVELESVGTPTRINGGTGTANCIGGYAFQHQPVVPGLKGKEQGETPLALVCANFNNSGTVGPGGRAIPGPFKMDGNFNQFADGVLQIELAGETPVDEHDQLIVDGNVTLDGFIEPRILPGAALEAGEQFTIITATNGTLSGTFDAINSHGQYSLSYSPTAVTLTLIALPHPGDTNGDGVTNVDDLINIILRWGMCPAAPVFCPCDLTGDGRVDVDDLIAVILEWG